MIIADSHCVRLVVGLGNPGDKYANTRHNAGFWLLDKLAAQHTLTFTHRRTLKADICNLSVLDCFLCKPTGFMNQSGGPIRSIAQYYKISLSAILVVHDDLDLIPGVVRLKQGGGHGGHNGLRDIISVLGGEQDFTRLRLGIGHPGVRHEVTPYVLSCPPKDEAHLIDCAILRALEVIPLLCAGDRQQAMNELHRPPLAQAT